LALLPFENERSPIPLREAGGIEAVDADTTRELYALVLKRAKARGATMRVIGVVGRGYKLSLRNLNHPVLI